MASKELSSNAGSKRDQGQASRKEKEVGPLVLDCECTFFCSAHISRSARIDYFVYARAPRGTLQSLLA